MKLHVFVHNQAVATLDSPDGFKHVMTYHDNVEDSQFVSLLMPTRTESYVYPELHPVFRMNLPEGFLLSILQEELGPHVGASPLNLLSVVGRNSIGRIKVAAVNADPHHVPLKTERFIIKGTTSRLPGVALNEHLCMEVARRAGIPTAKTEVSDDGQALIVHRFDHDDLTNSRLGMEDICSLLALRPEQKYETTWERVVNRMKDVVDSPEHQT